MGGWHPLTPEEATRHYVDQGLSKKKIKKLLAPWLNHMTNAEYHEWEALLAELQKPDPAATDIRPQFADFRNSPDARLLAQGIAFKLRQNGDRMRRARLVAPADMRLFLGRDPTPDEVEEWVKTIYERDDTAIDVGGMEGGLVISSHAAASTPRRGRPKGTRSVPRHQIIDRFRSLRANYGRNPTEAELAANLTPRIEVRTLQEHLAAYELTWPIE